MPIFAATSFCISPRLWRSQRSLSGTDWICSYRRCSLVAGRFCGAHRGKRWIYNGAYLTYESWVRETRYKSAENRSKMRHPTILPL
jgi:hypothetical protein